MISKTKLVPSCRRTKSKSAPLSPSSVGVKLVKLSALLRAPAVRKVMDSVCPSARSFFSPASSKSKLIVPEGRLAAPVILSRSKSPASVPLKEILRVPRVKVPSTVKAA